MSFVFHSRIEAIYKIICPLVGCKQRLPFTSSVKEWRAISENLDSEQRARLWQYRLHVENQVYSRMTVFLTYETILIGVIGVLYTKPDPPRNVLTILIVLGVFITLIWFYVQHNIKQVLVILDRRASDNFPEHKESMNRIVSARRVVSRLTKTKNRPLGMKAPALLLITYFVPILILLVWMFLLLFQLHWLP